MRDTVQPDKLLETITPSRNLFRLVLPEANYEYEITYYQLVHHHRYGQRTMRESHTQQEYEDVTETHVEEKTIVTEHVHDSVNVETSVVKRRKPRRKLKVANGEEDEEEME